MGTRTPTQNDRPRLQHALTATAFAWMQVRTAWKAWYRGYVAERRQQWRR